MKKATRSVTTYAIGVTRAEIENQRVPIKQGSIVQRMGTSKQMSSLKSSSRIRRSQSEHSPDQGLYHANRRGSLGSLEERVLLGIMELEDMSDLSLRVRDAGLITYLRKPSFQPPIP